MHAVPDFHTQLVPKNVLKIRNVRKVSDTLTRYMLQWGLHSYCLKSTQNCYL